jgi:Leucine-rich repeat (LRR) protein
LDSNEIKEIKGLDSLIKLQNLKLTTNMIEEIKGLEFLVNLHILDLCNNKITELKGLNNLINLKELDFSTNNITELKGFDNLVQLREIYLWNTRIKEIPLTIMNLNRLSLLSYDDSIIQLHPIIERFLKRNQIKQNKSIYNDAQNVHNSSINRSVSKSLFEILTDKTILSIDQTMNEIIDDLILTDKCKESLIEYSRSDDVHSSLNVTFKEVLLSVWNIIRSHPESVSKEIKLILNDEMKDSLCKCFTGRLSRLINCLNGFDDRVQIKIANSDHIANIIIMIKNKYDVFTDTVNKNKHIDIAKIKEEVIKELSERGYDQDTINEWIEYID